MSTAYQVQADRAFGYAKSTRRWGKIDVNLPLRTLVEQYHTFEVGLSALGKEYTFYSQYHMTDMRQSAMTLQQWLDSIAGTALPTLKSGYPTLEYVDAHYQHLHADLTPQTRICPPGVHYTQTFNVDDANDIVIILPADKMAPYRNNALYNIGGQWVSHQADAVGVRLNGAGKIARLSNQIGIGVLSWVGVGNVSTYPLKNLAVNKVNTAYSYYSSLICNTPVSITGKTVGLVIGGIMHWLPANSYIGDKSITFALPNYSLLHQLSETRDYYDWTEIGLNPLTGATSAEGLMNPEIFLALLKHESSFLVIIDNPYIEFDEVPLNKAGSYGRFHLRDPNDPDSKKPLGILLNDYGKAVYYWPTWEDGEWTFHTTEGKRPNLIADYSKWQPRAKLLNDARPESTIRAWRKPDVYMLRVKGRKK